MFKEPTPEAYDLQRQLQLMTLMAPKPGSKECALDHIQVLQRQLTTANSLSAATEEEDEDWLVKDPKTLTGLVANVKLGLPSIPTSLVHLLAQGLRQLPPLVHVEVTNASEEPRYVRVTTHVEGYSARAVATREIAPGKTIQLEQFPAFFPHRVAKVTELTPVALHVEVFDLVLRRIEQHNTFPVAMLARNTAILSYRDHSTNNTIDLKDLLAAWVTPHSSAVLEQLRGALNNTNLDGMMGYLKTDANGVRKQVKAIFNALKKSKIAFVNSPIAFGGVVGQNLQCVRLPRESLDDRSANCLDGSVLMASLLEAAALDAGIIVFPGHACLAYRPEHLSDEWEYVETAMIGSGTFEAATRTAREFKEKASKMHLVDIPKLRTAGVTPME